MLSTFKLNFELGLITAMTITIALVVDFLLLPAMLLTFDTADYEVVEAMIKSVELFQRIELEQV